MKTILTLTLFFSFISTTFACDICPMDEYSTTGNRGYIGVFYRYSLFQGYNYLKQPNTFSFNKFGPRKKKHNSFQDGNFYEDTPDDFETFQTIEIRFNYNYKNKWNFLAVLPYHYNISYADKVTPQIGQTFDSTTVTQGIGDLIIGAQRLSIYETDHWRHQFKYGVALSLPTGNSELRKNATDPYNDPTHLPGKGATDFILRGNYTASKNDKYGVKVNLLYATSLKKPKAGNISQIPTSPNATITDYRFGDRASVDGFVFYVIGKTRFKVIPKLGYAFNFAKKDKANAQELIDSGGYINYGIFGLDITFGRFTWQTMYNAPLHQFYNGQQLKATGKLQTGVLFSLKTKE